MERIPRLTVKIHENGEVIYRLPDVSVEAGLFHLLVHADQALGVDVERVIRAYREARLAARVKAEFTHAAASIIAAVPGFIILLLFGG